MPHQHAAVKLTLGRSIINHKNVSSEARLVRSERAHLCSPVTRRPEPRGFGFRVYKPGVQGFAGLRDRGLRV